MTKKKLSTRLRLLNGGRSHFLDFIRNLAPQVALLSVAMLLGAQLDFTRLDLNNTVPTVLFYVIFGSFLLAFYANSTTFYERCFPEWKEWLSAQEQSMTIDGVTGPRRLVVKLRAIWDHQFIEFTEVVVALWFLQVALAIVIAMAINSADGIWRTNHPAQAPRPVANQAVVH